MGLYFIPASKGKRSPTSGETAKNREKSLEKDFRVNQIEEYLKLEDVTRLNNHYPNGNGVFVWGANPGSTFNQLHNVSEGEYVVDVKNRLVVHIFKFCFYVDTAYDTRLQEYIGWDRELPVDERRPYQYVFFLKDPQSPDEEQKEKDYFKGAFKLDNSQWLVQQRWFSDSQVTKAMERKNVANIEKLLGISEIQSTNEVPEERSPLAKIRLRASNISITEEPDEFIVPDWLRPITDRIKSLRGQTDHSERDHEAIVEELFRVLGYTPTDEIKFQRGRIDIIIEIQNKPLITVEVKKDWDLSERNTAYVQQAFNYSNETGTKFVVVTNGDRFLIYDRARSFRLAEM